MFHWMVLWWRDSLFGHSLNLMFNKLHQSLIIYFHCSNCRTHTSVCMPDNVMLFLSIINFYPSTESLWCHFTLEINCEPQSGAGTCSLSPQRRETIGYTEIGHQIQVQSRNPAKMGFGRCTVHQCLCISGDKSPKQQVRLAEICINHCGNPRSQLSCAVLFLRPLYIDRMLQTKLFHFQWVRYPGGSCSPKIRSQMLKKREKQSLPGKELASTLEMTHKAYLQVLIMALLKIFYHQITKAVKRSCHPTCASHRK